MANPKVTFIFPPDETSTGQKLNINFLDVVNFLQSFEVSVNTPSQITAQQNDYSVGTYSFLRLSTDASRTITGFLAGNTGRVLWIANVGSTDLVLAHQNTSSAAANRIITPTATSLTLNADDTVELIYDGTTARWRVLNTSDALWG